MSNILTGKYPSSSYSSLLTVNNGGLSDGSLQNVGDGLGVQSSLKLSQTAASFSGSLEVSGSHINFQNIPGTGNLVGIDTTGSLLRYQTSSINIPTGSSTNLGVLGYDSTTISASNGFIYVNDIYTKVYNYLTTILLAGQNINLVSSSQGRDITISSLTSSQLYVTSSNGTISVVDSQNTASIDIAQQGATSNQALLWNGTKFSPQSIPNFVQVTAGTPRTGPITLVAGNNITITDDGNGSFTFNSSGGGYASSFSTNVTTGQVPLVVNCTDTTQTTSGQTPTGWAWSVIGGSASDYTISSTTAQNPTITFNSSSAGNTYQIRLLASGGVTFTPALVTITPQAVPVVNGDFSLSTIFNFGQAKIVDYNDYASGEQIIVTPSLVNAQTCSSVTSAVISSSNSSPAPTLSITAANINAGSDVASGILSQPTFPVSYTTTIVAVMNNSDGSTTTKTHSDIVRYYTAGLYQQTQSTTAPSFVGAGTKLANDNYADGQGGTLTAGTDTQILWVAIPTSLIPNPLPKCWILSSPFWSYENVDGQSTTTLGGVEYTVLQYNLSGQGGVVLSTTFRIQISQPTN